MPVVVRVVTEGHVETVQLTPEGSPAANPARARRFPDCGTSAATGSKILGNYIGTDVSGSMSVSNNGSGIDVNAANANTIGGAVRRVDHGLRMESQCVERFPRRV